VVGAVDFPGVESFCGQPELVQDLGAALGGPERLGGLPLRHESQDGAADLPRGLGGHGRRERREDGQAGAGAGPVELPLDGLDGSAPEQDGGGVPVEGAAPRAQQPLLELLAVGAAFGRPARGLGVVALDGVVQQGAPGLHELLAGHGRRRQEVQTDVHVNLEENDVGVGLGMLCECTVSILYLPSLSLKLRFLARSGPPIVI